MIAARTSIETAPCSDRGDHPAVGETRGMKACNERLADGKRAPDRGLRRRQVGRRWFCNHEETSWVVRWSWFAVRDMRPTRGKRAVWPTPHAASCRRLPPMIAAG